MLAALLAVTTAAGTKAQAAPWADGRWYDASPYFNLPIPVCKLVPKCVQEGTCGLGHAKCPKNFEAFQGYCYRALLRPCVYEEAIQRCRDHHDSTLVSITNAEENLFVRHICGNHFCWLGLAEEPQGEDWYWIDGAGGNAGKLGYWNWAKGEPNNGNGLDETVAIMNFNIPVAQKEEPLHWVNGLWYDVPVHFALGQAICERKANDGGECPENWRSWGPSCYRFFHWPANFKDAEDRCRECSAFLVSISSDDEQYFVQDLCGDHMCWLGLEEKKGSEYWKWVDGSTLIYEHWARGEPNNFGGDESRACMNFNFREVMRKAPLAWVMSQRRKSLAARRNAEKAEGAVSLGLQPWADGTWYDAPSSFNLPITICKSPAECLLSVGGCKRKGAQEQCEDGWQAFDYYCYHKIDRPAEFAIALQRCEEHNSFLVSIETPEENEFVQKMCGNRFCWLGLRKHSSSAVWWWLDGRTFDVRSYSNWHDGEPNQFDNVNENAAIMNFDLKEQLTEATEPGSWAAGQWYDISGIFDQPTAICEKRRGDQKAPCEAGWEVFEYGCYKRLDWHWDFHTASERCLELDAHLVSIGTVEEQRFVQKLCGARMCWLGLSEHPETEEWFWTDNSHLGFQNWARGEPNNWHGHDENVAVMNMHTNFSVHRAHEEDLAKALVAGLLLLAVVLLGRVLLTRAQNKDIEFLPTIVDGARSPALLDPVMEAENEEDEASAAAPPPAE
ncbi:MRC1 [Symbiodinium sp. CCMP2592]|nr:MRC1 [Symbiodinium sp. CCMP2592]